MVGCGRSGFNYIMRVWVEMIVKLMVDMVRRIAEMVILDSSGHF